MSLYLDASVLVALFTNDTQSVAADRILRSVDEAFVVIDFAAAEFASAISRKVRTGELTSIEAGDALADFDTWVGRSTMWVEVQPIDISRTSGFLRRLDLALRTPDAVNIAIAQRLGATLATLDRRMARDAVTLGVRLA